VYTFVTVAWDHDTGDGGLESVHAQQTKILVTPLYCFEVYIYRGHPIFHATGNALDCDIMLVYYFPEMYPSVMWFMELTTQVFTVGYCHSVLL